MKTYRGVAATDNSMTGEVFIAQPGDSELMRRRLDLRLDLRNHSPTGFAWGYLGSGPAQLALAILADYAGDEIATRAYHPFKSEVIAELAPGSWSIEGSTIADWLFKHGLCGEG